MSTKPPANSKKEAKSDPKAEKAADKKDEKSNSKSDSKKEDKKDRKESKDSKDGGDKQKKKQDSKNSEVTKRNLEDPEADADREVGEDEPFFPKDKPELRWDQPPQLFWLCGIGSGLWILQLIIVRLLYFFFEGGWWSFFLFLLTAPLMFLFVKLVENFRAIKKDQLLHSISLISVVAMGLHAIFLRFFYEVYGNNTAFGASTWVIWSSAISLVVAMFG